MKNALGHLICAVWLVTFFAASLPVKSQNAEPSPTPRLYTKREQRCLEQKISTARTYTFKEPPLVLGAHGPKKPRWYDPLKKIIPFWSDSVDPKYTSEDVRILQNKFGLKAPSGETERSQEIRRQTDEHLRRLEVQGEQDWLEWMKANPATIADAGKETELKIRFKGLGEAKLPGFSLLERGIYVGPVQNQGRYCNSCWAFATADAIQINRQLTALRLGKSYPDDALRPNARQLMSCWLPSSKFCELRSIDKVLSHMVDEGFPLGGSDDAFQWGPGGNPEWKCEAKKTVKALTWDYVSGSAYKAATTDEIKRAIVTYGSVISMINFDDCLSMYVSGVFNEEQNLDGSHILLIIGWDDAENAWLVKNSYGEDWGEYGFAWIKYGSNNIGQFASFVVADPKEETQFWQNAAP